MPAEPLHIRSTPPEACAPPLWANLMLTDESGRLLGSQSVGMHGLPRVGDQLDHDFDSYEVLAVQWATTTDGTFKPTVHARRMR